MSPVNSNKLIYDLPRGESQTLQFFAIPRSQKLMQKSTEPQFSSLVDNFDTIAKFPQKW